MRREYGMSGRGTKSTKKAAERKSTTARKTSVRKPAEKPVVLPALLTEAQARSLTDEVKRDAEQLWAKLVQLYEGQAHIALGYPSWAEYFEAEFGGSEATAYRWLQAGRVMRQLPVGSPRPNEAMLRELTPLLDRPKVLHAAWAEVVDEHPKPTAAHVAEVVTKHIGPKKKRQGRSPQKPHPAHAGFDPDEAYQQTEKFAARLHPQAVPEGIDGTNVQLARGAEPPPLPQEDVTAEIDEIFYGTDFSNYVVGGLYNDRGNYDFDHPQYQVGLADIRGRVYELGWRSDLFTEIDRRIAEGSWRRQEQGARTERYGKKYGWISYYELAGRLDDRGELRDPGWGPVVWPDVDPTFPAPPSTAPIALATWAAAGPAQQEDWVRGGDVPITNELLAPADLAGLPGPWILVEAHLYQRNRELSRRVFGFVRGLLVAPEVCDNLVEILQEREYLGNDFVPSVPEDHTTFAGEIPWSDRFAADLWVEEGLEPYKHRLRRDRTDAGITIELLGHRYAFSSERTATALEHYYNVPSKRITSALGLRLRPATFDLVELNGRAASLTRAAPDGFEGDLLYLRRDLLATYADGRRLVQLAWGERELDLYGERPPEWLQTVYREGADRWRHLETINLG
jgi:hypothetical protein